MGIADTIHDSMYSMLKELAEYEYWLEYRREIIQILAVQLQIVKNIDGFGYDLVTRQEKKPIKNIDYVAWANDVLDEFIREQE